MKQCFTFLKSYLDTNRILNIKGPLALFEESEIDINMIDDFPAIYFL